VTDDCLTVAQQILLLCSRVHLHPDQQRRLAELAAAVNDWDALINKAQEHFVAGVVFSHIKRFAAQQTPADVLERWKRLSTVQVARHLQISAAQRALSENILQKYDFPHVFVKGNALAVQYYNRPGARPARDVDVLIPRCDIPRFWEIAQSQGYQRMAKPDSSEKIPIQDAVQFLPVIDMLSPTGVVIEVHCALDKAGRIFDTDEVVARAERLLTDSGTISVASICDHFLFICLHHSRHLFSHLHWLTDLDAIMTHERFSIDEVNERADALKIRATVDACIELRNASAAGSPTDFAFKSDGGRELLEWCLKSIKYGVNTERATRQDRKSPDFALDWQFDKRHRLGVLLGRLKPTLADYKRWPLPQKWWWLYYLTRPFRLLKEFVLAKAPGSSAS